MLRNPPSPPAVRFHKNRNKFHKSDYWLLCTFITITGGLIQFYGQKYFTKKYFQVHNIHFQVLTLTSQDSGFPIIIILREVFTESWGGVGEGRLTTCYVWVLRSIDYWQRFYWYTCMFVQSNCFLIFSLFESQNKQRKCPDHVCWLLTKVTEVSHD